MEHLIKSDFPIRAYQSHLQEKKVIVSHKDKTISFGSGEEQSNAPLAVMSYDYFYYHYTKENNLTHYIVWNI